MALALQGTGFKSIDVIAEPKDHGYRITISWVPPEGRGARKPREFTLSTRNMSQKRAGPLGAGGGAAVEEIILRHCISRGPRWLGMSSPRQLGSEIATLFRNLSRNPRYADAMEIAAEERMKTRGDEKGKGRSPDGGGGLRPEGVQVKRMSKSFIAPDTTRNTGATYAVLGPSFSGKTTLLVDGLNRLTREELDAYDGIFFFTESENAEPLEGLSDRVRAKFMGIYKCFCKQILAVIKKLNDLTKNGFRFLVVFDDITTLRGDAITKMVLTLRNAGISTVLLIQHSKLLNPGQRQSIHHYYIFNLRTEEWVYMLQGFLATHIRDLFPEVAQARSQETAEFLRTYMRDKIIHFDQRTDTIEFFSKDSIDR
jgi:hypothetical protein